jgi:PAS domain-containing protein
MIMENNKKRLRRLAEARLHERGKVKLDTPMNESEMLRMLHELQVHQIELEMQNEQLVESQLEVEAGSRHYSDLYNELYDFAPMGYFTLDSNGEILRVNLTGGRLLGWSAAN